MPTRRFGYVSKKNSSGKVSFPHTEVDMVHTVRFDVTHAGLQKTIHANESVRVTMLVPCANGVWFKTMLDGTPVWFLGDGVTRSYKTIYQEEDQE